MAEKVLSIKIHGRAGDSGIEIFHDHHLQRFYADAVTPGGRRRELGHREALNLLVAATNLLPENLNG